MSLQHNTHILVGTDGSACADAAVRWAAIAAARHGVRLEIVHAIGAPVDYGPGIAFDRIDYEAFRDAGRAALEKSRQLATAAAASIGELEITTELVEAPPIPVLRDRAKNLRMLVVGTQGLGTFSRFLLGSVSTALARHAECPVAVIREPASDRLAEGPVVVGVDGSPGSARAVALAFDEASHRGVPLLAVHAWSEFNRYIPRSEMQKEGEELVSEMLAGYGEQYPDVSIRRLIVEDRPARRLLHAAEHAQLIVVGSHGRGGFAGMTLGSVSQSVLHGAHCPVLIARSAD